MCHLTDNMYANKDIKKATYNKISGYRIQAAQSEQQANEQFELLSRTNAPAARYLHLWNIPADEWILYAVDKAGYKLYRHNTSNRVESQNGTFLGARNEGPLRFLDKTPPSPCVCVFPLPFLAKTPPSPCVCVFPLPFSYI